MRTRYVTTLYLIEHDGCSQRGKTRQWLVQDEYSSERAARKGKKKSERLDLLIQELIDW